jgi:hypothetical protein
MASIAKKRRGFKFIIPRDGEQSKEATQIGKQ